MDLAWIENPKILRDFLERGGQNKYYNDLHLCGIEGSVFRLNKASQMHVIKKYILLNQNYMPINSHH